MQDGADERLARGRPLSLALQGGGSFGAFTWGVLDRLLESPIPFDAISGASAGAVNAVLLAAGLAEAGGEAGRLRAREKLARFWRGVTQHTPAPFLNFMHNMAANVMHASAAIGAPHQLNPLNLNPLRDLLAGEIDFAHLRAAAPIRLLIAATRVRDGRLALFREHELTLDMVLASACLPQVNHAVTIAGEAYWDGGFAANPPLRDLVRESEARDILLVRILPETSAESPQNGAGIARRINEIAFTAPLQRELEAIEDLRAACKGASLLAPAASRRLARLRLHQIAAEQHVENLAQASPLDTSPAFIARLHVKGREAAENWVKESKNVLF